LRGSGRGGLICAQYEFPGYKEFLPVRFAAPTKSVSLIDSPVPISSQKTVRNRLEKVFNMAASVAAEEL
jgi:hypothetical protein